MSVDLHTLERSSKEYTPIYGTVLTARVMSDSNTVFSRKRNLKKNVNKASGRVVSNLNMEERKCSNLKGSNGESMNRATRILRWISNVMGSSKNDTDDNNKSTEDISSINSSTGQERSLSSNSSGTINSESPIGYKRTNQEFLMDKTKTKSRKLNCVDHKSMPFFDPPSANMMPGLLSFSKNHPYQWHEWECELPTSSKRSGNKASTSTKSQYGTQFVKYTKTKRSSQTASIRIGTSNDVGKEFEYLRMIYNGEYDLPETIKLERERQLKLLHDDRGRDAMLRASVSELTNRISSILKETLPRARNDDLIILKEKNVSELDKKRQEFERQRTKFNQMKLIFDREHISYKKLQEERRKIQIENRSKQKSERLVPNLTQKEVDEVKKVLQRSDNGLLMNRENLEIFVRDFKTLGKARWLNDTIIEFFMKNIEKSNANIVAFNSFFYTTLSERGYQGVRRWMKRKKKQIAKLDKIFVPVNLNQSHWALGMIDIENKRIIFADSLSNGPNAMSFAILADLKNYVIQESQKELGDDFELVHLQSPQQPNGYDCGIYVCMNTLYLSKENELQYDYKEAVSMRTYIGHLILSDSLK
ncbi:Ubiquitin-like-specific protease 1 [Nakaseomyces glabratus]|nr:Ubiquitin-like-specific protease 1 [Nakaseomyces glabratus]KTB25381.1 Ubiquitin-like-specific protease 1 [Nakaseomyces glabratus]